MARCEDHANECLAELYARSHLAEVLKQVLRVESGAESAVTADDVSPFVCSTVSFAQATYYHVNFEAWLGYPLEMDSIKKNYASMAPISKGTMGYEGLATMYLPKPNRDEAYATDGKALEFYKNWNYSWNEPWKYSFKSIISDFDTADLMPCSASVMSDDATMQRHVTFTGDADGVVIAADDAWLDNLG
eukprot:Skav219330  [mRNA]  locus=scaffold1957:467380:470396:- [translate_table: standard]